MEKQLTIKTADHYLMYGVLNIASKKSRTLVVFVHGLTGNKNEHIFYNAARFFPKRGFDTFRFDLYSGEKGGRVLRDCTISTHAADLNTVVRYFRPKYQKIFVVGHSLGGMTILLSDTSRMGGIVLWDAATLVRSLRDVFIYSECLNAYLIHWGVESVMSKAMYDEWRSVPKPKEAMAHIEKPIKVIVAGKGGLIKAGEQYFKYAREPKEFAVIKGAGHVFDEWGAEETLFASTLSFLKKIR